ncbi:GTPase [Micromonospora auratinigra]|uniref:50S ribosome-binding GTPase n=1 Tax=Micromonospora auratinigra TaxID=261654 RepID=A0A1A8Z9R4_9ACTN|nr:GTPase [Micromonospora auratinigra]SBT40608.1 50S ribosome-binding GTPase [Micromonospora auratinigra]
MTTQERSFAEAVRSAVEQGRAELTYLDDISDELVVAFTEGQGPDLPARLHDFTRSFPVELRGHLDRERASLGTFNIAFFGRTGVGKSTLLSVFGQLDGEYVSPGDNDFTTEVRHVEWRDCRLFDTPGINGWGASESRDILEARARAAVEVADIVLLCFDSQSQQAMEFQKIAAWVRDRGKPVVAVLNSRNRNWRHPAVVPESGRGHLSETVRQHADNIRTQLGQIGLFDVPVVAIQSQRALHARAATPFRGPSPSAVQHERERFGRDYLDRWSNFPTLERLIIASIAEGGADLRLTALREDIRSRCRSAAGELEELAAEFEREAQALERRVESMFAVLGYPEDAERAEWLHDTTLSEDLVELSEQARGAPYTSPPKGSLDRHVRHLATSYLAGCHRQAKINVDDAIQRAFAARKTFGEPEFRAAAYDEEAMTAAAQAVWVDRQVFLRRELEIAVDHESAVSRPAAVHAVTIAGDEGGTLLGDATQGTGIALGLGALALPFIWNPAGWVLAATLAGIGIVNQAGQYFGKRASQQGEEQTRKAMAGAIADGHRAVDRTFAAAEDTLVQDSRRAAWTALGPAVGEALSAAIGFRMARARITPLLDSLRTYADAVRPAPAVTDVLRRAQQRMGRTPAEVNRVLLGEDWLDSGVNHQPVRMSEAARKTYASRQEADRMRLARAVTAAWRSPTPAQISSWRQDLEDAARRDSALTDVMGAFWRVSGARPVLAVLGDYNSGKSSLVHRIMVDGGRRPDTAFDTRALPATTAASRYRFPGFDLMDTPGLQSGHDEHDAAALEAVTEAALVLVVVNVNLLVGNTSMLEDLWRGTELSAAKDGRIVFLINRCDELGIDPLTAPDQFLNLQSQKRDALRTALAARGADVPLDRIHCLCGDPFGLVGGVATAQPADFDEHRLWDGVAALTNALFGLSDEQLADAASSAALEAAVTALKRHRHALHQVLNDGEKTLSSLQPLITGLRDAIRDAVIVEGSLREDARRMVDRHAVPAKSAVADLDRENAQKLKDIVESWWKTPQFEADLERYRDDAARRLGEWHGEHLTTLGRELRAAEWEATPELAAEFQAQGTAWYEEVTARLGTLAEAVTPFAQILGKRDTYYAVLKQFNYKFKPWGAVKGSARVARAGLVLGAIASVADIAGMATDAQKAGQHREQQESAFKKIDETAAGMVDLIMRDELWGGHVAYLEQRSADLEALLDEHVARESSIADGMDSAKVRVEAADDLVVAAEAMGGTDHSG